MKFDSPLKVAGHSRYGWTIIAFALAGVLISALVVWQLGETAPARWCQIAKEASESNISGCYALLLKLLDLKDHAVMGLLCILALTVAAVVVVALGVKITGEAPGGAKIDVSADTTTVTTESGTTVAVPTPPSQGSER